MTITETDLSTGKITVRDLTPEEVAQRALDEAQALADAQVRALTEGNRTTITDRAAQALRTNRTYLGLASPTAAQQRAQVAALTRQNTAVIRLLLNQLDGTD